MILFFLLAASLHDSLATSVGLPHLVEPLAHLQASTVQPLLSEGGQTYSHTNGGWPLKLRKLRASKGVAMRKPMVSKTLAFISDACQPTYRNKVSCMRSQRPKWHVCVGHKDLYKALDTALDPSCS